MSQQASSGGPEKPTYPPTQPIAGAQPTADAQPAPQYPYVQYPQPGQNSYQGQASYPQQNAYPGQQPQSGQYAQYQAQHPAFYQPQQNRPDRGKSHWGALTAIGVGILVVGGFAGFGVRGFVPAGNTMNNAGSAQQAPAQPGSGSQNPFGNMFPDAPGNGDGGSQLPGSGSQAPGDGQSQQGSGASDTTDATKAQEVGLVDINTDLKYENGEAAGSGMILTSNGEILTNNHVIEGATSIEVTVVSTQKQYTARVVGDDVTDDVAVLRLTNASGLTPIKMSSGDQKIGDAVTGVGNAGGDGGTATAAPGKIVSLNQTITTDAEASAQSESLDGLIQVDSDIQPGDSGGPLYNSKNEVLGIDTAASTGGTQTSGYAIPISDALKIADQIVAGNESETISLGYPAFLGVELSSGDTGQGSDGQGAPGEEAPGQGEQGQGGQGDGSDPFGQSQDPQQGQGEEQDPSSGSEGAAFSSADPSDGSGSATAPEGGSSSVAGAQVAGVVPSTPADQAGIVAGDTITAVSGQKVSSAADLTTALTGHKPGDSVKITWADASGASHSKTVTLVEGPAA